MPSKAIIAYGASVERSQNGTTYTDIPEALGIAIPQVEKDWVEVTSLDSVGGYKEYIPGLKDAGTRAVPCNYTPDGYEAMIADEVWSETNGPIYYRTTLKPAPGQATGDVFTFRAYPTVAVDDAGAPGDKMGMTVTLRMSGAPTWVKGPASV